MIWNEARLPLKPRLLKLRPLACCWRRVWCSKSSWSPSQWKNLQLHPHQLACDIIHHHRGRHPICEPELQLHVPGVHVFLFISQILYLYSDVQKMMMLCSWEGWAAYLRHEIEMEEVQQQGNGSVPILHLTHARTHTHNLGHAAQRVYSGLCGCESVCAEMLKRGARSVCLPHTNINWSAQAATSHRFHIQTKWGYIL